MSNTKKYRVEITDRGWSKFPHNQHRADLGKCILTIDGERKNRILSLFAPGVSKYSFEVNNATFHLEEFVLDWDITTRRVLIEKSEHYI